MSLPPTAFVIVRITRCVVPAVATAGLGERDPGPTSVVDGGTRRRPLVGLGGRPGPRRRGRPDGTALRVVVLDAAAVVGAAAGAAGATAPAATARGGGALVALDAEAEEHGGDEQRGVGAPDEAECVPAEGGVVAVLLESLAGNDKGSTRVNRSVF